MKKIISVIAFAIALSSCSSDDDKNQQDFFNLKVGNMWVYKKYNVLGNEARYSGSNDTVRVTGTEIHNEKVYYKLTHSLGEIFENGELLRINEKGHLESETGFVVHPGSDKNYTYRNSPLNNLDYGYVDYALEDVTEVIVEDKNYTIYPYIGHLTASETSTVPEGKGSVESYQPGLGFVVRSYRYISAADNFIEYRLVHHE